MIRKSIAAAAAGVGVVVLAGLADMQRPAQAWTSPYPWCAFFGGRDAQYTDCHYFTVEQCRATVFGVGGYCYENPSYAGPADGVPPRYRKHKKKRRAY